MKALKKWWKNSPYKKQDLENKCEYELIKIGWRAALKWIQNDIAYKNGILQNDFIIRQSIKEELNT